MTIDIEKLAFIYSNVYDGYTFKYSPDGIKKFAEAYAAKVLEDKEREIAEANKAAQILANKMCEYQASNNDLREALEEIRNDSFVDSWQCKLAEQALSKTPAQSLTEHDNDVIESCSKRIEQIYQHVAAEIRALKGK